MPLSLERAPTVPVPLADASRPEDESLSTFQTFALDPGASETAREPFKGRISVSYSTLGPLDILPIGFVSIEAFLEAHLSCPLPRTEVPDVGNQSLARLGEVLGW